MIANLHSYGSFVSITGTIISKLKDEPGDLKMTEDEETWFGKSTPRFRNEMQHNDIFETVSFLMRYFFIFQQACHFSEQCWELLRLEYNVITWDVDMHL